MKFLKNKGIAFLILIFAAMAEYFHLLFVGELHSRYIRNGIETVIYWDDMVYYFFHESFILFIMLIIFIKIGTNKASRAMLAGICFWFFIEWVEITLQLAKINDARIYINDGSWIQLFTCLTVFILVLFGSKK